VTRTISVLVRTSDFRTLTRSRTLQTPTDVGRELFLAARELIAGIDLGGLPVRLVGVRADALSTFAETVRQPTLEEAADAPVLGGREVEHAMDVALGRVGGAAPGGRASQVRGVPSRSTTTFVPADLS